MKAVFFPRKDYDIEVCQHRYGKLMTYTEQTDTLRLGFSYEWYTELAKEREIKVGAFAMYNDYANSLFPIVKQDVENNKIWLDVYSYTPEIAEKIRTGGVITREEFYNAYETVLLPYYEKAIGKKPIALSYAYGNTTYKDYVVDKFLTARNSGISGHTNYGIGLGNPNNVIFDKNTYNNNPSTIRWFDSARSSGDKFQEELDKVAQLIDNTKVNGGWVNNFTHWHNYKDTNNEEWAVKYLDLLKQKNNDDICFAGYGEAVAYMVFRDSIERAVMYEPKNYKNTLIIRLLFNNIYSINDDFMLIPLSVKFTTKNTILEGKNIKCNLKIIDLGNDNYIVEIPYSETPYAIITII